MRQFTLVIIRREAMSFSDTRGDSFRVQLEPSAMSVLRRGRLAVALFGSVDGASAKNRSGDGLIGDTDDRSEAA